MLSVAREVEVAGPPSSQQVIQVNQENLETFAERLVRKHILSQHVESGHPVAKTEEKLVRESTVSMQQEMDALTARGHHIQLVQMEVFKQLRASIRVLIRLHDVDEDIAETAVLRAVQEAFARVVR